MAVRAYNAIDNLTEYIDRTIPEGQRTQLTHRVMELGTTAPALVSGLFVEPIDALSGESAAPNHVTHSIAALVELLEKHKRGIEPFEIAELAELTTDKQLIESEIRDRCIMTLYQLSIMYEPDRAFAFVEMLERATNQTLLSDAFTTEDLVLYRKLYVLTIATYAHVMAKSRLEFMLGTELLVLALLVDVDISSIIRSHINTFNTVSSRRNISLDFATVLRLNPVFLGKGVNAQERRVSEWTEMALAAMADGKGMDGLYAWIDTNEDVAANDGYTQSLVAKLLTLYGGLIAGEFIVEGGGIAYVPSLAGKAEAAESAPASAEPAQTTNFATDLAAHKADLATWIQATNTLQSLVEWTQRLASPEEARKELVGALSGVVSSLDDIEVVQALANIGAFLHTNKHIDTPDLLVFNQEKGTFEWHA